ncbi:tripartite tricarboxylate transporter substrate binding protein [Orrella sp. JC864]|uniref:Bug family tripartite tricarboxylate transporter substrate binding protein n=1 Tax=Orrella sp. JC864 TaxID=3120298 RepID=UPI003008F76C
MIDTMGNVKNALRRALGLGRGRAARDRAALGLAALGLAALGLAAVPAAQAQDYPARPVTLLVPFTGGGATDVLARAVAEGLAKELKQPVIVENVPGAGGSVGQARAARSPADGYTLLLGNVGTLAANASLYRNLSYDILADFTALASVGDAPQVLSIRADFPARTLEEFADYARQNGERMNSGTAGVGSGSFLGGVVLNEALGIKVPPVHYRGAAQTIADVMAGHIDYTIESSSTAVGSIASGKVRGLVVLRPERVAVLPDVPAAGETRYPGLHYDIWNMMLVPKGVPEPVLEKLNAAINRALATPALRQRYEQMGVALPSQEHRSLAGSAELLRSEVARWKTLLEQAGVKPDGA